MLFVGIFALDYVVDTQSLEPSMKLFASPAKPFVGRIAQGEDRNIKMIKCIAG
jgi:hypothetical protein